MSEPSRGTRYARKIRSARRSDGLCADCGADSPDHYRCEPCRAKVMQAYYRRNAQAAYKNGTTGLEIETREQTKPA